MKKPGCLNILLITVLTGVVAAVGITLVTRRGEVGTANAKPQERKARSMPVEVADVQTGRMEARRLFSGTLEASAELIVAPKISGRIARSLVDLADRIERGAEVALLDDAEYAQAVTSAEADLAVAKAQAGEGINRLELAESEYQRMLTLTERGVASTNALESAETDLIMRKAALQVANANVQAREAALETTRIRLSYTRVTAAWSEGDRHRVVAARYANEGDTVSVGTPLFSIVGLSPMRAVFFVPERDYASLAPGQAVDLFTDAFTGIAFPARISRIAPVFQEDSRQARVEMLAENEDERLKPGMFVRARVVLTVVEDATTVPKAAISQRNGETGVFQIHEEPLSVGWVPVETGIESEGRVQIVKPALAGRVVTLGHQLLADGVSVTITGSGETGL
ncbi:MAG TPA: efflux RND transporter periplasmic adaptor subunit [Verrucomicrobia bacterium]|nr:efflux RND transporter periplasmic adaptor subunit [Verrucomicrobiota bacterium]